MAVVTVLMLQLWRFRSRTYRLVDLRVWLRLGICLMPLLLMRYMGIRGLRNDMCVFPVRSRRVTGTVGDLCRLVTLGPQAIFRSRILYLCSVRFRLPSRLRVCWMMQAGTLVPTLLVSLMKWNGHLSPVLIRHDRQPGLTGT